MGKPRIVSLISSATEILHALGGLSLLVGRSHECDFPPEVHALPACTRPLIDVTADSRSIDTQVKTAAHSGLSIYEVFDDVLARLEPTHILTQVQCDVCAVSLRDVERSIASRLACAPEVVALNPASLADIWDDFRRVGAAASIDAEPVIATLQAQIAPVALRNPPTVVCIEWIEPLMAAGNWTPELISLAGGVDVFGAPGVHSPWITWDQLKERDPDIIVVAPCGFDQARARTELHWITDRPDFETLKAVRTGHFHVADGNRSFNRPGPSVVESYRLLRDLIGQRVGN